MTWFKVLGLLISFFFVQNILYLFNQTPGAKECLITKDGDELVRHVKSQT